MQNGQISEERIREIVEKVVASIEVPGGSSEITGQNRDDNVPMQYASGGKNGVYRDMDDAVNAAAIAQERLMQLSLKKRVEIIEAMRQVSLASAEKLSRQAVEETGLGRVTDKINKNILAATKTPGCEDVFPDAFTGDDGLTLTERAPYGVIASITPCTNPSETIINNGISMIAAGNSVVFNPHPSARAVSLETVGLLNRAVISVGGPPDLLTSVCEPSVESSGRLMSHRNIRLVVVTGGPGVVAAAMKSGKKVIAAGPGNPPAVVDETADIEKAGRDIVSGSSLDNNIVCIAEKEVFVVNSATERLLSAMEAGGAYVADDACVSRLLNLVMSGDGHISRDFVGRNAAVILKELGIRADDSIRTIVCRTAKDHPFVSTEMMMPILPVVSVPDVGKAMNWAVDAEGGCCHTAVMHSRNVEMLHRMARLCNASIFVKNGPSYAGLGMGGEGFTSFTIASPTGEGLTRARTFTRERRCVLVDYFRIV